LKFTKLCDQDHQRNRRTDGQHAMAIPRDARHRAVKKIRQ